MKEILRLLNSLPVFWALLALPGIILINGFTSGQVIAMDMVPPTGEFSARFMILALMVTPLATIFGTRRWIIWLTRRRRSFGVAAFAYAALHLVFYLVDMELLRAILDEFWAPGIWTGWAAFAFMLPLALTSNNASMRWLGKKWKRLQRLAYLAALLTLAHWLLIHDGVTEALVHFLPLVTVQLLRIIIIYRKER